MKRKALCRFSLIATSFVLVWASASNAAFAQTYVDEWISQWMMNHDGHRGTLVIRPRNGMSPKRVNSLSDLEARYYKNGEEHGVILNSISNENQTVRFRIYYRDGERQNFTAHLFSWDKTSMAGTTSWAGRTFGFYATKR